MKQESRLHAEPKYTSYMRSGGRDGYNSAAQHSPHTEKRAAGSSIQCTRQATTCNNDEAETITERGPFSVLGTTPQPNIYPYSLSDLPRANSL